MGRNRRAQRLRLAGLASAAACLALACGTDGDAGASGPAPASAPPTSADPGADFALAALTGRVVINGKALDEAQLRAFQQRYGQGPRPGRYWYDAESGLFGHEGGPSLGWIHPGHDFGPLASEASRGDTGVFVNGREIDATDYVSLAYILGGWIQPGRYWLDGVGNYGYEGYDFPVGNLYVLMVGAQGGGSGGDNHWSTRFSAGNYNADNSAGYVQCPDGTFVSYGL